MREDLIVRERGTVPVDQSVFQALSSSAAAFELVCDGTISLIRSKATPYGVRAFNKVGQALLEDGTRLVVAEKVTSSLKSLLQWSLPQDIREVSTPSPIGIGSPILLTFSAQFLRHIGEYLEHGRIKEYQQRLARSSFPHGKICVRETMSLYSRGQRGVLAFQRAHLTADLSPNRLLALGLLAVESYASTNPNATQIRDLSRSLAPIFEDVDWFHLMRSSDEIKFAAFEGAFSDERVTGSLRAALAFARALVMHLGSWPEEFAATLPHSHFINLETLFEDAVRQVLTEVLSPRLSVSKGDRWERALFQQLPDNYVADPDVVIGDAAIPVLVADCKYKDIEHQRGKPLPLHSDVYELHTHCIAFGARRGLLTYPGQTFAFNTLGQTPAGVEIFYVVLGIKNLKHDLVETLARLGIQFPVHEE